MNNYGSNDNDILRQAGGFIPPVHIPGPLGSNHEWPVPSDGVPVDVRADQPPNVQPSLPPAEKLATSAPRPWVE